MTKTRETSEKTDTLSWDQQVGALTGWCHYLQSSAWTVVKSTTDWQSRKYTPVVHATPQPINIYSRRTPFGRLDYVPKLAQLNPAFVPDLTTRIRREARGAIGLTLELDQAYHDGLHAALIEAGWHKSPNVQYADTVVVNLDKPLEEVKASFKKRARWEINASERRGVIVTKTKLTDKLMKQFFDMLSETATRGNFLTRSREFTTYSWREFSERGQGTMYVASKDGEPLSMGYVITIGARAYYKDGASVRSSSELFASRAMQWGIIKDLHQQGVKGYDLCGVPSSASTDPGYAGILTFKSGFAPPIKLQGCYSIPLRHKKLTAWRRFEPTYHKLHLKLKKDLWY